MERGTVLRCGCGKGRYSQHGTNFKVD
jgi:uncharacterized beta-barrel protein YwiB (DUF1934 family)